MDERDPAEVIAERLRLPPARDAVNEPWRYWLLRYLAALAAIADYESTPFRRDEARIALEMLIRDAEDVILRLRGVPPREKKR
jgi:hypothetical protein